MNRRAILLGLAFMLGASGACSSNGTPRDPKMLGRKPKARHIQILFAPDSAGKCVIEVIPDKFGADQGPGSPNRSVKPDEAIYWEIVNECDADTVSVTEIDFTATEGDFDPFHDDDITDLEPQRKATNIKPGKVRQVHVDTKPDDADLNGRTPYKYTVRYMIGTTPDEKDPEVIIEW